MKRASTGRGAREAKSAFRLLAFALALVTICVDGPLAITACATDPCTAYHLANESRVHRERGIDLCAPASASRKPSALIDGGR